MRLRDIEKALRREKEAQEVEKLKPRWFQRWAFGAKWTEVRLDNYYRQRASLWAEWIAEDIFERDLEKDLALAQSDDRPFELM